MVLKTNAINAALIATLAHKEVALLLRYARIANRIIFWTQMQSVDYVDILFRTVLLAIRIQVVFVIHATQDTHWLIILVQPCKVMLLTVINTLLILQYVTNVTTNTLLTLLKIPVMLVVQQYQIVPLVTPLEMEALLATHVIVMPLCIKEDVIY